MKIIAQAVWVALLSVLSGLSMYWLMDRAILPASEFIGMPIDTKQHAGGTILPIAIFLMFMFGYSEFFRRVAK